MSEVSDHKQDDLLAEYGTATTAYLLMAMSIDSLERKNKQLKEKNEKLSELVQYILDECYGDDWFGEKAEELGFEANY